MTKSIIKAKDYDVKIKFNGEEQFIGLGDILINEKPLSDYLKDLEDVINFFKVYEKEVNIELERLKGLIADLSVEKERLNKELVGYKKVVENAIKSKLKAGF